MSLHPETPPLEGRVTQDHQGIIDKIVALEARARAAENNELQYSRLLVPRLVGEINDANAQNKSLQQMIRESKDTPADPEYLNKLLQQGE